MNRYLEHSFRVNCIFPLSSTVLPTTIPRGERRFIRARTKCKLD